MENQAPLRKPYTSDLSDGQWEIALSFIPTYTSGRPRTTDNGNVSKVNDQTINASR